MARTIEVIAVERPRRYHWPEAQLNIWLIVMLASSCTTLGIFSYFMAVQQQMNLGVPWLFPYEVTISAMAVVFIVFILMLISQRQLLPGIVIIGTFILFVLWLTGLIQAAVTLFGPLGNVNANCNIYVNNQGWSGVSVGTLAWLTQKNICNCWEAAFALEVVGTVFLLWMMVMAWQVNRELYV